MGTRQDQVDNLEQRLMIVETRLGQLTELEAAELEAAGNLTPEERVKFGYQKTRAQLAMEQANAESEAQTAKETKSRKK